jgi:hypothetical protein
MPWPEPSRRSRTAEDQSLQRRERDLPGRAEPIETEERAEAARLPQAEP